jgi:hypothetical protein
MVWIFWVVVALVALFVSQNVRYALKQYWANHQRAVFTVYVVFLILFVYLVLHLTTHVLTFTQEARQTDLLTLVHE